MSRGRMKDHWAEAEQDKDLSTVGGRIRYARLMNGMTQQAVADALPDLPGRKKSRASIAQYEMGNAPSLDIIVDLAAVLHESPSYLAFGVRSGTAPGPSRGHKVPIIAPGHTESFALLPRELLQDLGADANQLTLVRLDVDAPAFGIRSQDYLLLDATKATIRADGKLYAVNTSAGVALVRGEPSLSDAESGPLQLTGGQGTNYSAPSGTVQALGHLVASVKRQT